MPPDTTAALAVIDQAVDTHRPIGVYALFSGGDDSLTSTAIAARHPLFRAAIHLNTGIGIEDTRRFVRETCARQGWPLIERMPPRTTYETMCLSRGLPGGPTKHAIYYHRLKDEALQQIVTAVRPRRRDRVVLVSGIRKQESVRRMRNGISVSVDRRGPRVYVKPILDWSARECLLYLEEAGLPRNPVSVRLHRSGECLCGALADPAELDEIAFWYPDVARRIRALEQQCFERGLPYRWGRDPSQTFDPQQPYLPLCQSCPTRWERQADAERSA